MRKSAYEGPGMEQLTRILQQSWRSPVRSNQEPWDVGAGSGYGRERQARWDAQEMRTATTKVRWDVYEEFQAMCQERGKTPYAVLQGLLRDWMEQAAEVRKKPRWTGWHSSGGGDAAR